MTRVRAEPEWEKDDRTGRELVQSLIDEHGTQAATARFLGVSPQQLSQFMNSDVRRGWDKDVAQEASLRSRIPIQAFLFNTVRLRDLLAPSSSAA